jgi:nitroimidazol reductase NimA-like FMN-containing flavoprotein (pyridoxamine 5'-phosphate oxidase superfamily)
MNPDSATTGPDAPAPSARATVHRAAERGHYEPATIHAIVDAAQVCHVAFAAPDPVCIPTACWRVGDRLYIHGSNGSRMMKHLGGGAQACVAITFVDGLVMARSAFNHSMNFRSVVIHGAFELVADADKPRILDALVDHIMPGRSAETRRADRKELAATTVLGILLHEAASKVRTGPPLDKEEDLSWPAWAGVLPLRQQALPAQTEAACTMPMPAWAQAWGQDGT